MCLAASIHAEQLLPKGHGYPLWHPEPDVNQGEVRLGDVGYIWEGFFNRLFNVILPASDPVNRNGVPYGFIPLKFNPEELVRTQNAYLPDTAICSQTVRRVCTAAKGGASSPVSSVGARTHLGFECVRNKGAVLVINGGGAAQEKHLPNDIFPKYMREHHDSWYEFARQRGHDVSPEDIIMVRGTVKAAEWTVAAFTDETRHQFLHLDAQGGGLASIGVSLALSEATSMSVEHRSGASEPSPLTAHDRPRNQCIFLSRYKMRYRKFWRRGEVRAAGYRKDESLSDDDDFTETVASDPSYHDFIESDFVHVKPKDPLDVLADYIFENSHCDIAVLSDEDIQTWIENGHDAGPDCFEAELLSFKPRIDIFTDEGYLVGRLSSPCQAGPAPTDHASVATPAMHPYDLSDLLDLGCAPPETAKLAVADISSSNHLLAHPGSLSPITFGRMGESPHSFNSPSDTPRPTTLQVADYNTMPPIALELCQPPAQSELIQPHNAGLYAEPHAFVDMIGTNFAGDYYGDLATPHDIDIPQTNRLILPQCLPYCPPTLPRIATNVTANNHSNYATRHYLIIPQTYGPSMLQRHPYLSPSTPSPSLMDDYYNSRATQHDLFMPQSGRLSMPQSPGNFVPLTLPEPSSPITTRTGINIVGNDYSGLATMHAPVMQPQPNEQALRRHRYYEPEYSDRIAPYNLSNQIRDKDGLQTELQPAGNTTAPSDVGAKDIVLPSWMPRGTWKWRSYNYSPSRPSASTTGPHIYPTGQASMHFRSEAPHIATYYPYNNQETRPTNRDDFVNISVPWNMPVPYNMPIPWNIPPPDNVSIIPDWPGHVDAERTLPSGSYEKMRHESQYSENPIHDAHDMWLEAPHDRTLLTRVSERSRGFARSIAEVVCKFLNCNRPSKSQEAEQRYFDSSMPRDLDRPASAFRHDHRRRRCWSLLFWTLGLLLVALCAAAFALFWPLRMHDD